MIDPRMSESDWQGRVIDFAQRRGWWVYHWPDSRRATRAGWPDLTLVRHRLILAELKTDTGRLSGPQRECHERLLAAGLTVTVWRPRDWPDVMRMLGERDLVASDFEKERRL